MAVTTVGLVYSITTGRLRSIVIPDYDSDLPAHTIGRGEAMLVIPMAQYAGQSESGLQAIIGLTPTNDRYISVDQNTNVISSHIADPVGCDDVSPYVNCTLIAHPTAKQGDYYINGVVVRPARPTTRRLMGVRVNQLTPQMS